MHSCSGLLRSRALYASLKIIPYSSGKCKCFPEISRRNFARRKRCGKKRFKNIEISPNERQNCQKPWRLGRRHFVICPRSRSRNGAGRIYRRRVSFDFYFILSSRAFLPHIRAFREAQTYSSCTPRLRADRTDLHRAYIRKPHMRTQKRTQDFRRSFHCGPGSR